MNSGSAENRQRTAIPSLKFSTAGFRRHEQFDAWREFSRGMTDIEAITPAREGFLASSEVYQLGSIFLTNYVFPSLKVDYGEEIVRRSRLDHWCLGVMTRGRLAVGADDKGFRASRGDLALYSYALPFAGQLDGAEYSSIFFSRDDFWDIADELDRASQLLVTGPMSQIIADLLLSVKDRAEQLTAEDAAAIREAFGALVRAMVRRTPTNIDAARAPIAAAQFDRVRRFIAENLRSPGLNPAMICTRLGLSRRYLYYLFEKHGGVAAFIRNRRLAACHDVLTRSDERKLISLVAYEYGFTNASAFSRQFQERYGFSPSEVRSAYLNGENAHVVSGNTFVDWLIRDQAG